MTDEQKRLGLRDGDADYGHCVEPGARPVGRLVRAAVESYEAWAKADDAFIEALGGKKKRGYKKELRAAYAALNERNYHWRNLTHRQVDEVKEHYQHRMPGVMHPFGMGNLNLQHTWEGASAADTGLENTPIETEKPKKGKKG